MRPTTHLEIPLKHNSPVLHLCVHDPVCEPMGPVDILRRNLARIYNASLLPVFDAFPVDADLFANKKCHKNLLTGRLGVSSPCTDVTCFRLFRSMRLIVT